MLLDDESLPPLLEQPVERRHRDANALRLDAFAFAAHVHVPMVPLRRRMSMDGKFARIAYRVFTQQITNHMPVNSDARNY